jgi:hypothetical protein
VLCGLLIIGQALELTIDYIMSHREEIKKKAAYEVLGILNAGSRATEEAKAEAEAQKNKTLAAYFSYYLCLSGDSAKICEAFVGCLCTIGGEWLAAR